MRSLFSALAVLILPAAVVPFVAAACQSQMLLRTGTRVPGEVTDTWAGAKGIHFLRSEYRVADFGYVRPERTWRELHGVTVAVPDRTWSSTTGLRSCSRDRRGCSPTPAAGRVAILRVHKWGPRGGPVQVDSFSTWKPKRLHDSRPAQT